MGLPTIASQFDGIAIAVHMSPIELLGEGKRRMEAYIPKLLDADYGEYPKMTIRV
jgi:hypothetical protein